MRRAVTAAFGFAALLLAPNAGAYAQSSTPLVVNGSLIDNGWTISITSFNCTVSQFGSQSTCDSAGISLANDVLEVVNTGRNVSFALANSTAGQPVLSFTNSSTGNPGILNNKKVDITYTVSMVKTSSNAQNLSSLSVAVQGAITGNATPYSYTIATGGITDGASLTYVGANGTNGSINPLSFNASTGIAGPVTFTPSTIVTLSQDLSFVAIPQATVTFTGNPTNAPEPATLALMAPGLIALTKARRSRKRKG